MYRAFGKRSMDLIVTLTALILLSPLIGLVAVLVRLRLGTPVFFRQQRPGFQGRPFILLKFRTMTDARDAEGHLLPDPARLTTLGRFLRSTSLDELPELINVVKGDMSLVGPRPLLMQYLPYYTAREWRRFELLPGISGWAQVNGRNNLAWDARLACDVWYVENCSFRLDLNILWITLLKVLRRADVGLDPLDLDEERRQTSNAAILPNAFIAGQPTTDPI
jgi:lipopolysaccharide/colanic/teichoic acid biosynthesis glycosyltransferase